MVKKALTVLSALFLVWLLASYVDVIAHNMEAEPHYYSWNFFTVAFD